MENCYICGTKLQVTNFGRKHCPNCGILENEEQSDESNPSYIG